MHVTVCICTRNRGASIAATLKSLFASTYEDFDVVIVDQSANDDTAQAVQCVGGNGLRRQKPYVRQPGSNSFVVATARQIAKTLDFSSRLS